MSLPDLVVTADGPLSVQCQKCSTFISGTAYPLTELHLRTLTQLQKIHQEKCGKQTPRCGSCDRTGALRLGLCADCRTGVR